MQTAAGQAGQDAWMQQVKAFVMTLAEENYDDAIAMMDQKMRDAFADGALEKTWQDVLNQVGAFEAIQTIVPQQAPGGGSMTCMCVLRGFH